MTSNLNRFGALGVRYEFWALWDSASPNYIAGTDGSLAAGEDSGMGRAKGVQEINANTPAATAQSRQGDNGVLSTFIVNPTDSPAGSQNFGSFDQIFDVAATGRAIKAEGPHDISLSSNQCYTFKPMFLVVNSPASSDETGSVGEAGWQVIEYLYTFIQPLQVTTTTSNTPHVYNHTLVFNERGVLPYGETITTDNYGLTQAWKTDPYWSPYPVTYHTYVGSGGSAQTFTLDETPAAADANALQIWDNGTKLEYTTNFAVSTSTKVVTFVSTTPASGHFAVAKYQFVPGC
jgi:hypothetical protein